MIEIKDRVRNAALQAKITTADAAAALIKPGMNIGASEFECPGDRSPQIVGLAMLRFISIPLEGLVQLERVVEWLLAGEEKVQRGHADAQGQAAGGRVALEGAFGDIAPG